MARSTLAFLLFSLFVPAAFAQRKLTGTETGRTSLPRDLPYQKVIRDHIGTLTEKDFTHGVAADIAAKPTEQDAEYLYRQHLYTLFPQPLVGTKRGTPAVNAPPKLFLLSAIESPEGVKAPPVWPETLMSFVQWKHPGNPYFDNRALKLRSFVTASVMLLMLDDQLDNHPERGGSRADWLAYHLVVVGSPYPGFKDTLPVEVRKAYETLLRKMGRRVLDWGPKGEEPNMDIITNVGLWYVSNALGDASFTKEVEEYSRRFFADPRRVHPAGYFVDNNGIDMGYQGTTNYFAVWLALASQWPFAREAVERSYRLRAHLSLPEPDGKVVGPSHFNSRTSSDAWGDQWSWGGARDIMAALVTNEAAYLVPALAADELKTAADKRAQMYHGQLRENPVNPKGGFIKDDEIISHPWKWRMWHSFNFPGSVNFGYEFYPANAYANRTKLESEKSPYLKSPYLRDESFVRDFEKAFLIGKFPSHAAIIHSGPVGMPGQEDSFFKFSGPLGFGGGQLSAFWTPATGCVILGRRGGNSWSKAFDLVEEWRTWPIHAVSGCRLDGKAFTSGRIAKPDVVAHVQKDHGTITVSGIIPVEQLGQGKVLEGRLVYTRQFTIEANQVTVATSIKSSGQDKVAELYESLPIFLNEASLQPKAEPTTIEFQVNGKWMSATVELQKNVTAIRLTRFKGAVLVTFDQPRNVKLSPTVWTDSYLSRARCRNVLIDLLDKSETPEVLKGEQKLSYRIAAIPK